MAASLEQTLTSLLAAKGQPSAQDMDELYERAAPALIGWVTLNLHGALRSRIDVEEIVQETWLRALRNLSGFDPAQGSFRGWLLGIARNVLLESFRRLRSQPRGEGATEDRLALAQRPDSVTSVTRRAAREDGLQRFIERVGALGEEERVLVICCGLEGEDSAEAARRLGISAAAAAKRWQRLRASLAERALPRELLAD